MLFKEFIISLYSWRIWTTLAIQDIRLRYRGSVLGPFWITISTAITIYAMGYLYGGLFGLDRQSYLPYFATGMIIWNFIAMVVNESTKILVESKPFMENIKLPIVVYLFRLISRNVIIFAHNLLVYFSIVIIFHLQLDWSFFLLFPALAILCLIGILYGTIISLISTRFPDFGAIISNLLQVSFFVTPIMWMPKILPGKFHFLLVWNPFVYLVNLLRNPLLGYPFTLNDIYGTSIVILVGLILFVFSMVKYRSRIIFWL